MIDTDRIARQVLLNCDISDAGHAGLFSICGLALRLRDLYKWEKGLDPWEEKEAGDILEWIGCKEELWESLAGRDFNSLRVNGEKIDPFDTDAVNRLLGPMGLMYGAGYARKLKPTFFLAAVREKLRVEDNDVFILGRELARDMLTLPALCQGDRIFFRKESARMFFWDQLFYLKKSGAPFLAYALRKRGIESAAPESLRRNLDFLLDLYQDVFIYHEVGELMDRDFGRHVWREIVAAHPQSVVEHFARTVKDLLADFNAHGTLRHIVQKRDEALLALYAAFFDGLARALLPELRIAVMEFSRTGDWGDVEKAVDTGYEKVKRHKDVVIDLYRKGLEKQDPRWTEKKVEDHIGAHGHG